MKFDNLAGFKKCNNFNECGRRCATEKTFCYWCEKGFEERMNDCQPIVVEDKGHTKDYSNVRRNIKNVVGKLLD